jgi:anti-sigma factor RsiW
MNCDWVQQNISLYLYNELADDARHELEQHLQRCNNCAAELAAQQEFQAQMNVLPVEEPSASFLAGARMRLQKRSNTPSSIAPGITALSSILRHGCGRCASRPRWLRSW